MKAQEQLRVMLVDDDREMLAIMAEVLETISGLSPICFNSPVEAIQVLRANPSGIDLVISDFDMPWLDGIEMCHVMRGVSPEIKTILCTGNTGLTEQDAFAHGFNALLRKPFPVLTLLKVIDAIRLQENRTAGLTLSNAA